MANQALLLQSVCHCKHIWSVGGTLRVIRCVRRHFHKVVAVSVTCSFVVATGSHHDALESYQKAVALAPARLIHRVELGRTLDRLGRKEQARHQLEVRFLFPLLSGFAHAAYIQMAVYFTDGCVHHAKLRFLQTHMAFCLTG